MFFFLLLFFNLEVVFSFCILFIFFIYLILPKKGFNADATFITVHPDIVRELVQYVM